MKKPGSLPGIAKSQTRLSNFTGVSIRVVKFFVLVLWENDIGNLIGIALNLWIALGFIVIFIILILPLQEHGISLHLFMLSWKITIANQ